MFEKMLDVDEVAAILKLSVATIRKWVFEGKIPCKRLGRRVRFSPEEIQTWVIGKGKEPLQKLKTIKENICI